MKVFKSGNSKAVRLPAEIAYDLGTELEIVRTGDMLTMHPVRRTSLKDAIAMLRATPPPAPFGPVDRAPARETRWDRAPTDPTARNGD
ncbi:MAG: hypothetical protein WDN03_00630 [Rhizomicrobium sp.]